MGSRVLVLWLLGGVGVVLLYAAVKGKSPTTIVTDALKSPSKPKPLKLVGDPTLPGSAAGGGHYVAVAGWVTDQYGNPVTPIDPAYKTSPATFRPPNVVA